MKARGGKREGAGRKTKVDEQMILARLSPLDDLAFKALKTGVQAGEFAFVKLFFEYRFGKPQDKIDLTTNGNDVAPVSITLNLS